MLALTRCVFEAMPTVAAPVGDLNSSSAPLPYVILA